MNLTDTIEIQYNVAYDDRTYYSYTHIVKKFLWFAYERVTIIKEISENDYLDAIRVDDRG